MARNNQPRNVLSMGNKAVVTVLKGFKRASRCLPTLVKYRRADHGFTSPATVLPADGQDEVCDDMYSS